MATVQYIVNSLHTAMKSSLVVNEYLNLKFLVDYTKPALIEETLPLKVKVYPTTCHEAPKGE
jgi:hypothetical protein